MNIDWNKIISRLAEASRTAVVRLIFAAITLVIGSFIIKFIIGRLPGIKRKKDIDPTVRTFLHSFTSIALWIILLVCIVAILGVPMASVVAAIASAGLAIGLAMQGSLSNFAGGIMILLFRPFGVDDFIESSGISGTVISVGIFYTEIRTPDNKHITIPNGTMMNSTVTNYSKEAIRRVDIDFSISYDADTDAACELIKKVIADNELIKTYPEPFVKLTTLGDSSVTLTVRVWVDRGDFQNVKHALIRDVRHALDGAGISIPYPQLDVHVK
ncbi:MAG: mechanosensitive ion channel [Clostridia bacterium]|nr:mechanosensitive ion channel [Clostridia bacterium]